MKTCSSCNREVTSNYAEFRCPECGKSNIVRCQHCRETVKTYKCEKCNFVGP
jgi:hypothetical protein